MLALMTVVGLAVVAFAFAIAAVVSCAFVLLKLVLWLIVLPLRLLFKLIWLPVGLAFGALGMLLGAIALPIALLAALVVGAIAIIGALVSLIAPLIPFVLLGLLVWAILRKTPEAARPSEG